jgi:hypothetical protein
MAGRHRITQACLSLLGASLLLVAAGPARTLAYNLESWQEYWPGLIYGYQQDCQNLAAGNQIPSWFRSHITQAADNWNSSPTPVRLSPASDCVTVFTTINGYTAADGYGGHTICREEIVPLSGGPGHCFSVLMQLNTGSTGAQPGTPVYDVYLPAHEFGHSVGLDHSGDGTALMAGPPYVSYSCYSESNCPTVPKQDDINGTNHMYPNYYGNGDYNMACNVNNASWFEYQTAWDAIQSIQPPNATTAPPAAVPSFDPSKAQYETALGAYTVDQTSGKAGTPPPLRAVAPPGAVCMAP